MQKIMDDKTAAMQLVCHTLAYGNILICTSPCSDILLNKTLANCCPQTPLDDSFWERFETYLLRQSKCLSV